MTDYERFLFGNMHLYSTIKTDKCDPWPNYFHHLTKSEQTNRCFHLSTHASILTDCMCYFIASKDKVVFGLLFILKLHSNYRTILTYIRSC